MSTPPPPPPPAPPDQRLWSTLTHIGGIFFGFLVPLITYLVLKDRGEFVAEHTKTALNFQLTMLIANIVAGILWFFAIGVLIVVFSIIAAVKANAGELYQYPLTIRFIR